MPHSPYPPVLLVAPPQYPSASNYLAPYVPSPNAALPPPIERDFKIVGEEESE